MVLRGESSPFRSAVGAAHDCFQWGPLGSDDAQVTRRHRSRKVSELSARSDRVAKTTILPGACSCLHARVERVWKLRRKPAAQLRKKISAVIALTLPILSINPDGVSGATVAVRENNYPTILSFELESPYERDRTCASLGRVETVATMLSIARQQTLRNCR
jgi:hypothetical protein